MYCFGVSNSAPEVALDFLVKNKAIKSQSEVSIVPVGKRLSATTPPKRKIVFVVSISDFFGNLKVFNSGLYERTQVFVFASPLRLNELVNCSNLDLEQDVANRGIGFRLSRTLKSAKYRLGLAKDPKLQVSRNDGKYLTVLTDNIKRGSLLTPLMTFIYTLPRATHQTPVKELVARYFYKGIKLNQVMAEAKDLLSGKNLVKLSELLTSEIAERYTGAFKDLRVAIKETGQEKVNLKPICRAWDTNEYEIRYILSVIDSMTGRNHLRGRTLKDIQDNNLRPISTRTKSKKNA